MRSPTSGSDSAVRSARALHGRLAAALCVLMFLSPIALLAPNASSTDPVLGTNPDMTKTMTWNYDDPVDYTLSGASVGGGYGSLAWNAESADEDSPAEYASGITKNNIDITTSPGSITVDLSPPAVTSRVLVPGVEGVDTYIREDVTNNNYGTSTNIVLDGELTRSQRVLMWFDLTSVPSSAVLVNATLWLYLKSGRDLVNDVNVYAMTRSWTEADVDWEFYTLGKKWDTAGGDYDPTPYYSTIITNTVGWNGMDLSRLVDSWATGRMPNFGIIIISEPTAADSVKTFTSSDENVNTQERPRLALNYTLEGEQGIYESTALGPGTNASFASANWTTGAYSALTDEFDGLVLSERLSWTNDPSDGSGSYDVGLTRPGWLHVVGEPGMVLGAGDIGAQFLHEDVTHAFEATTRIDTNITDDAMGGGLLVVDDEDNWVAFCLQGFGVDARLVVIICDSGNMTMPSNFSWAGLTSAYLRIAISNDTAYFYRSTGGSSWTLQFQHTAVAPYQTRLQVGLCIFSGSATAGATVDFDFLHVVPSSGTMSIEVRLRTGNSTTPGDGTWTAWSAPLTSPYSISRTARYLQYQVVMITYRDWVSRSFDGFACSYERYSPSGVIETADQIATDLRRWLSIDATEVPNGGSVVYSYSTDHGTTWEPLVTGVSNSISDTEPFMKLRIELATTNTLTSPTVDTTVAQYAVAATTFYVSVPSTVVAGEPFAVLVEAKDGLNRTITHWTGTVALSATDAAGTGSASSLLSETSAYIGTGGGVVVSGESYTTAETIRIKAEAEGVFGLSTTIVVLAGPAVAVSISPRPETLFEFSSYAFIATALDAYGNGIVSGSYSWTADASIGTLNTTSGRYVLLDTGVGRQSGNLAVECGGFTDTLFISIVPPMFPPTITGTIDTQVYEEDFGAWDLNITSLVSDPEDSWQDMRWYVTNEWVVSVSGENETGNMDIQFETIDDLYGNNVLHLVVVDSDGMSASTDFLVQIMPVNDRPVVDHIAALIVTYDQVYIYDFGPHVHDVDNSKDELTIRVDTASQAYATVKWLVIEFLYPQSLNGTQQFVTVSVSDLTYTTSTTVLITVSSVKVPFSRNLPSLTMNQGATVERFINLDDYFDDPDDSVLSYGSVSQHVEVTINANHTVDFEAPTDWWGTNQVIFTAENDEGARCEEVMTVEVIHVNQPPSLEGVPDLVVRYDERYNFDLRPYLTDVDDLIETLSLTTDNAYIAVIDTVLSLMFPRSLDGTTVPVAITVSDGELSDFCSIGVTVSANRPPVALALPHHSFLEDAEVPYPVGDDLASFFEDLDGTVADMTFTAFTSTPDINATASTNALGEWHVMFDAVPNWNGICMLTVRGTDVYGALDETTVTLEIIPQPDPPVLSPIPSVTMIAGSEKMIDLAQYVSDPDSEYEIMEFSADCVDNRYLDIHSSVLILSFDDEFLGERANSRLVDVEITVLDEDGFTTTTTLDVTVQRNAFTNVHDQQWLYVAMILTGGAALGLLMVTVGMRRRPFVIRDMMLIHNDGFLISRYASPKEGEVDENILSSMLTAVLNFVEDSLDTNHDALKTFGFKDYHVLVERGKKVFSAIVYEGDLPTDIDATVERFLVTVERIYKKKLMHWSGDIETDFAGIDMLIRAFVKDHSKKVRAAPIETVWRTRQIRKSVRPKKVSIADTSEDTLNAEQPGPKDGKT